ncbi:flagellar hook-length control protein FliK [Bacillus thuringiensis]|uniref:Flagellar hook-length control protein FliK n=1 Tax=Bacillus thuringiensis TaxID=1428 RepID=A0A9X6Z4P7_BACTU|nr:flagellar hook-length control protein FliK [Bacillus thuringiensis]OTY38381.1 flagellar hook-length control protein FliK [Bacillus thuringiensis serovar poloniensis]OTZ26903.1 flagellar hook-length control protein FliK [Bacillus thuringiensis serovar thompsoni]PEA52297.1 flagellar hook-length control protein FliK [Bacillus thuringiensis]PES90012.1 flagellar hook-length control protein FliK [Bacillus thuringiensis]PEX52416.1 flagellar hook-length control protein FliK [Bacillus thuringiensis]
MDEVNVVIQSVLPVQQSLPSQKEKGLEIQSKNEDSSFDRTMRIENKKQPKTEKTKREEAPKEEKKEYNLSKPSVTKEEPIVKKEEKKETEQLLLAVSEQMVAIEQLHVQPELLYQYIQKIQELYKEYGNIKLNELPAAELQQLQELLSNMNIKNAICLEDTMQMVLDKMKMPEQMMQALKVVETETCNIAKKQEEFKDVDLPKGESDDAKVELPEVDALNDSSSTGAELLNKTTSTEQVGKSNSGAEKVSLPDLGKKMEAQVEALQKFVVKQERVLFQLNPEKLGTLTVFMKKHGDQIDVHVEMEKHDAKKRVEIIFDELKLKLKEKEINIQISYSDKDENRKEQREQEQRQKQKLANTNHEKQQSTEFAGLLEE